ncbi:hypothetical protein KEM48_007844 [Puccinia striiformis f. sp. tritici PST-130]|nr:hypothetical protein KEM48_007844 [Puccinia striiformis f. sp. tritici PST-130]
MRKVLKFAGAAVQGTTPKDQIEANPDPQKLLDRISTNHKARKEQLRTPNQPNLNGRSQVKLKPSQHSGLVSTKGNKPRKGKNPKNRYQANYLIIFQLLL